MTYPSGSPGFDPATFEAVINQLTREMTDLIQVNTMFGNWREAITPGAGQLIKIQKLAGDLTAAIKPSKKKTGTDFSAIISEGLFALSCASGLTGAAELGEAGALVGVIAAGIGIGDDAAPRDNDTVEEESAEIWADAYSVGSRLQDRFTEIGKQFEHFRQVVVSDWGKLQAGDALAQQGGSFKGGGGSTPPSDVLQDQLYVSSYREVYKALLPIPYRNYTFASRRKGDKLNRDVTNVRGYRCQTQEGNNSDRIFGGTTQPNYLSSKWGPGSGDSAGMALSTSINFSKKNYGIQPDTADDNTYPPASITGPLIAPISFRNATSNIHSPLGMDKNDLFAAFPRVGINCYGFD